MAYECQNFKPGQILTAGCMNNIDEWLEYICGKEITKVSTNELGQLEITFCNGEVLNCGVVGVTVEHIEESVKDGGKNIIRFSDGTEVVVRNGNKGTSGVHFGADAPPSNATIWINPNGEPTTIENWEFDLEDGNTEAKTVVVLGSNDSTDSDKLPLLKVKDENGNWVEIPAIKGFDPIVETSKSGKVSTIRITTSDGVKTVTVNDGFDPKVAVSKSGKVTTVKITDAEGEKTATINDGFDPVVETTKSGKVTTVKITDASGTKTATINDGVDITKVEQTTASSEDGGSNVMTVTLSNGNKSTFTFKNGKQGTSVTVASVSESTEAGGSNVVQFSDGKSLTVKNGSDANVTADNVKAALGYTPANKADIATTVSQAWSNSAVAYTKISGFGDWGNGALYAKGFSMLITSRAGELVWVAVSSDDSNTNAKAIRLLNTYSKINAIYYSASESAIYVATNAWCNNVNAHILSNVNGDYVPTIATASALASDAVKITITEFGASSGATNIGDSTRNVAITGSGDRPTYNGANMALQSDIPSVPTKTDTWTATYEDGTTETIEVYIK